MRITEHLRAPASVIQPVPPYQYLSQLASQAAKLPPLSTQPAFLVPDRGAAHGRRNDALHT